jgi:hypothetical protein
MAWGYGDGTSDGGDWVRVVDHRFFLILLTFGYEAHAVERHLNTACVFLIINFWGLRAVSFSLVVDRKEKPEKEKERWAFRGGVKVVIHCSKRWLMLSNELSKVS